MKKILLALLLLLAVSILTSCDPWCDTEWVMVNHSGHDVEITCFNTEEPCFGNDLAESEVRTVVTTLNDGDSLLVEIFGRMGVTSYASTIYDVKELFWCDSVRFAYDDGLVCTFVADSYSTDGPYNFDSENYVYQEKPNGGLTFRNTILWSRLTYTLTADDYARWGAL